jgi:hypothetical protein
MMATVSGITTGDFRGLVDSLLDYSILPAPVTLDARAGRHDRDAEIRVGGFRITLQERHARMTRGTTTITCPDEVPADLRLQKYYKEMVHAHIRCDGCETMPITGPRMHCAECGDTDYCLACYDTKGHCHAVRVIRRDVYERHYE